MSSVILESSSVGGKSAGGWGEERMRSKGNSPGSGMASIQGLGRSRAVKA